MTIPKKESNLSSSDHTVIETLIKHNLNLQKVTIDLVKSNQELVKRIDTLVSLFEEASKHITSTNPEEDIRALTARLDSLIEQNKDLARGLILLEEYVRNKSATYPLPL